MNILISENFIWIKNSTKGLALSSLELSSHFSSILSYEEEKIWQFMYCIMQIYNQMIYKQINTKWIIKDLNFSNFFSRIFWLIGWLYKVL